MSGFLSGTERAELVDKRIAGFAAATAETLRSEGITDTLTLAQASGLILAALDYSHEEATAFLRGRSRSQRAVNTLAHEIHWLMSLSIVKALEDLIDANEKGADNGQVA